MHGERNERRGLDRERGLFDCWLIKKKVNERRGEIMKLVDRRSSSVRFIRARARAMGNAGLS
jgi:hypothetical protein